MVSWNTPLNFGTGGGFGLPASIPANTFTGAAGTAASAAGGAAAAGGTAASAAGAGGALGFLGGPAGLGIMAGSQLLSGVGSLFAGAASQEAAQEAVLRGIKYNTVANLAGQKYLMDQGSAREKESLIGKQLARSAGFTRPDDFAALLSSGRMGTSEAARMATSPLFRA